MKPSLGTISWSLLFLLVAMSLRLRAQATLEEIYRFSQTDPEHVTNQVTFDFEQGGNIGLISAYSRVHSDAMSGAGQCVVACDLNGNGIPDYVMWGPGVANRGGASPVVWFDVIDAATLAEQNPDRALMIDGPETEEVAAGDINGDGVDDLVVGDITWGEGSVFILFGRKDLPKNGRLPASVWNVRISCDGWSGAHTKERFGRQIKILDLNHDGLKDIAVSAFGGHIGRLFPHTYGVVALFWGRKAWPAQMEATSSADLVVHGTTVFDYAGGYMTTGDLNADGVQDLVFTSYYYPGPGARGERGKVWILYGGFQYPQEIGRRTGGILDRYFEEPYRQPYFSSLQHGAGKGFAFPAVGDFNGDGFADLIVGETRNNEGTVHIVYGPIQPGQDLFLERVSKKSKIFPNEYPEFIAAQFGQSIQSMDVNGDGCADLLVGAKGYSRSKTGLRTGEGGAFLFLGSTNPPALIPTAAAAARYLLQPTTFLEGGLGLSFLRIGVGRQVAIGDPAVGKVVLWPLSKLPQGEVAAYYSRLKTSEILPMDYLYRALAQPGRPPLLDVSSLVSKWSLQSRPKPGSVPSLSFSKDLLANLDLLSTNIDLLAQWTPRINRINSGVNEGLSVDMEFLLDVLPNVPQRQAYVAAFKRALEAAGLKGQSLKLVGSGKYTIGEYFGQSGVPSIIVNGTYPDMLQVLNYWGGNQVVFLDSIQATEPSAADRDSGVVRYLGDVSATRYEIPVDHSQLKLVQRHYESRSLPNVEDLGLACASAIRPHMVMLFKDAGGQVIDRIVRLIPYEVLGIENGGSYYGNGRTFAVHSEASYGGQFTRFRRKAFRGSPDKSPLRVREKMSLETLSKVRGVDVLFEDYPLPGDPGVGNYKPGSTVGEVKEGLRKLSQTNSLASMWKPALESARLVIDDARRWVMIMDFTMVPDKERLNQHYDRVKAVLARRYYSVPVKRQVGNAPRFKEYEPCLHPLDTGIFDGIEDYRDADLGVALNTEALYFTRFATRYRPDKGLDAPEGRWDYFWDRFDTDAFLITDYQVPGTFFSTIRGDQVLPDRGEFLRFFNDSNLPEVVLELRDKRNQRIAVVTNELSFDLLGQCSRGGVGSLIHSEAQSALQYYFTPSSRELGLFKYDWLGLNSASRKIWRLHVGVLMTEQQAKEVANVAFLGNASPAPTITTAGPVLAGNGQGVTLSATGGDLPYRWQVLDGVLPDGMTFSEDGIISGNSMVSVTNVLLVQVVGGNGASSTKEIEVRTRALSLATLSVSMGAGGTASPGLGGQQLEVGRQYSLVATPSAGYVFSGWKVTASGVLLTNVPTTSLTFTMKPGLALEGTFQDVAVPVLSVVEPKPGVLKTDAVLVVRGAADDNDRVTGVFWNLNGGGWLPATSSDSWKNWSASLALREGTNHLALRADDPSGNQGSLGPLVVTMAVPPTLVTLPIGITVRVGASASMTVVAQGTAPLAYQWRRGGMNIPGATASSYVIGSVRPEDAVEYSVVVSNAAGAVVSPGAWLVVDSGHGGGSWLRISRMSASEALLEVQVDSNATRDLLVSDDLNRWTVERRLEIKPLARVDPIVVQVGNSRLFYKLGADVAPKGPTILVQPSPASLVEGQELGLTVEATGSGNLSYQWRLNDLPILGAVLPVLRVAKVSVQDAGRYTVIVTDSTGSVASNPAAVSVSNGGLGVLGMVPILAGTFLMGSPVSEPLRYTDETQHQVQLTRDFLICDHEVTQAEYKSLVGNNPSGFRGDDLPVESVTWAEAVAYCEKLTLRERAVGRITQKQIFRLPTEAEWEYACRAGTTGQFSGNLDTVAWYQGNSGSRVHSVKSKPANGFGLHDMHGNVSEWCADWYGSYPNYSLADPVGPAAGTEWPPGSLGQVGGGRVVRGGNYQLIAPSCRSATRMAAVPTDRYDGRGFRVVLASIP